ncbi:hypothetical protein [Nocardia bovistercoris]|uniref:Calcineurin-like phosphoesterase domain-containing protein n=1 Tax=Nocardia bovistercoris TaxID=2785916 RepID=A0A931IE04_9NOCA|nr:hypothetical protein [Nocardia bovistercoris]MBH0778798.1 hypothetical protein [Nocardia bovistercoris]
MRIDPTRPVRISRWQAFNGDWLASNRFYVIAEEAEPSPAASLVDLIATRRGQPRSSVEPGPAAFNFQASDLQIGKIDNGGSERIIARYLEAVERAHDLYQRARRNEPIDIVHLLYPGDCVEGNQSQSGRTMWRTDLTVTEQVEVFQHLIYVAVDAFAADAASILVDVVNGNHDESQRFQTTRPGDGWATHAARSVAQGLTRNVDAYGHVEIRTPEPERGYMTVPVGDTTFVVAHGHQWRRGKAMDWWSDQTFHGQGPGGADVLAHGHYHTYELETTRTRTRIQSSTLDGGSNYYRERHGSESRRGALTYLTRAGDVQGVSLV